MKSKSPVAQVAAKRHTTTLSQSGNLIIIISMKKSTRGLENDSMVVKQRQNQLEKDSDREIKRCSDAEVKITLKN